MDQVGTYGMLPASSTEVAVKKRVIFLAKESWCAWIPNTSCLGQKVVLRP
jgi:hypothetical protein